MPEDRCVIHVDFDYFYAQCEEIRHPEMRTIPVCVCIYSDRGGDSGAVATANYIARKYGVRSGMSIYGARKRLEETGARFVPVDFDYISDVSEQAMNIMEEYADTFEYVGRDEAYLDVTQRTGGRLKGAAHLAQQIKVEIRKGLGLTCTAGVSYNKLLSKMASNHKKPDGLTVVGPKDAEKFLAGLELRDIHGLGGKSAKRLESLGAKSVTDAQNIGIFDMQKAFGRKPGTILYNSLRGVDDEPVQKRPPSVQYGKIVTLRRDTAEYSEMSGALRAMCDALHQTVSGRNLQYRVVGIQLIHTDMKGKSRSRTLRNRTSNREKLYEVAESLLREALNDGSMQVRRLGVKVSDLEEASGQQDITNYF